MGKVQWSTKINYRKQSAMFSQESILLLFISLSGIINVAHCSGSAPVWAIPSSATSTTIAEDSPSGSSVFSVLATDVEGDTLIFAIHEQTPASPAFQFDTGFSRLNTPAGLDAETTRTFTFTFSVSDTTSTVNSPTLTVNIQDVNEFTPVFNQTSYTATIYDTTTNGETILTVYASDDDVTSSLSYSITSGDTSTFSIGPTSGDVTLASASNLNPSSTPSYVLTVQVTDGTQTANVDASINVLDDPCSPNPCQNSGTCSSSGSSYTCTCQAGWIGTTCSTDDPCSPNPCQNSGTCSSSGSSYTCTCQAGWIGTTCSTDDPCSPNPCQNSGTCSSSGSSYTCTCQAGWIGTTCSTDDPCLPEPCENSGTCSISGSTYQCACTPEFFGKNCSDTPATDEGSPGEGLTKAELAGICVAVVLLCAVVIGLGVFYIKWRVRKVQIADLKYSSSNHLKKRHSSSLNSNSVSPVDMNKLDIENGKSIVQIPNKKFVS